jgi:hypothetical protein
MSGRTPTSSVTGDLLNAAKLPQVQNNSSVSNEQMPRVMTAYKAASGRANIEAEHHDDFRSRFGFVGGAHRPAAIILMLTIGRIVGMRGIAWNAMTDSDGPGRSWRVALGCADVTDDRSGSEPSKTDAEHQ